MSARYYGVDNGLHQTDVATGTSTTSKMIEVVIPDISKFAHKGEIVLALNYIINQILTDSVYAT